MAHGQAPASLNIAWREQGGPAVARPQRRGFGTFTLERVIGFQVGGRSQLRFEPGGVECDIELTEAFSAPAPIEDAGDAPRILVVEDEAMVAFVIEAIVMEQGWKVVGPVGRVPAALTLLREADTPIDAALLDVNLAGEKIWPVADALAARGIPFMFATGYDQSNLIPERFGNARVIGKPFANADLIAALQQLLELPATAA